MICKKCKKDFQESEIEISHNIPKYIGGTDKDGRTALCSKCHEEYEFLVLSLIHKKFFARIIKGDEDRRKLFPFMDDLKKQDDHTKDRFRQLAFQINKEWKDATA